MSTTTAPIKGYTAGRRVHAVPATADAYAESLCGRVVRTAPVPFADVPEPVRCAVCFTAHRAAEVEAGLF